MIWKQTVALDWLNALSKNTMSDFVGIEYTEVGPDYLKARMPVNERTVQPFRILHGGANVVFAESMGSVASTLCIADLNQQTAVGLEINANHLKSVKEGSFVTGVCRPIRVGRQIHVWQIEIFDEKGDLSCISRLTVSIINRR